MREHNEFTFGSVEFEMLLNYPRSVVHPEVVNRGIELQEINELRLRLGKMKPQTLMNSSGCRSENDKS